jgi:predicted O-linked N-acetylglucosamine transferase (SPINDLY family)
LLKTKQLDDVAIRAKTASRFAKHGIPESRLIFEGHEKRTEFFSAYNKIDIALDSFPYPGGTTTAESLWMGVPVLTLCGKHFLGRQGVGLLMNAGLSNWIANDREEYVSMAILHSSNLEALAGLRLRLRTQVMSSPLFSAPAFATHLEECLRGMWKRWVCQ